MTDVDRRVTDLAAYRRRKLDQMWNECGQAPVLEFDPASEYRCRDCGLEFPNLPELIEHLS